MTPTLEGIRILNTTRFDDDRGWFLPAFAERIHREAGITHQWAELNISHSRRGVIRGLHFQHPCAQAKIISVLQGSIWDVVVDLRPGSPTFGRWEGFSLSTRGASQIYIPPGFAHGFAAPDEPATVAYLVSETYQPESQRVLQWNDPVLAIPWSVASPILSLQDQTGQPFSRLSAQLNPPA